MSVLDEVGGYLALQAVAGTSAGATFSLTKSWLPDSTALQDKVVALTQTPGRKPTPYRLELDYPGIQVLVRGDQISNVSGAYAAAEAEMNSVYLALHGYGPGYLPSTSGTSRYYVMIEANHMPSMLHVDPVNRPVLFCNFTATRSRT